MTGITATTPSAYSPNNTTVINRSESSAKPTTKTFINTAEKIHKTDKAISEFNVSKLSNEPSTEGEIIMDLFTVDEDYLDREFINNTLQAVKHSSSNNSLKTNFNKLHESIETKLSAYHTKFTKGNILNKISSAFAISLISIISLPIRIVYGACWCFCKLFKKYSDHKLNYPADPILNQLRENLDTILNFTYKKNCNI